MFIEEAALQALKAGGYVCREAPGGADDHIRPDHSSPRASCSNDCNGKGRAQRPGLYGNGVRNAQVQRVVVREVGHSSPLGARQATGIGRKGKIVEGAVAREGISEEELLAGLRKLGHENPSQVKVATLEKTGHISAVARQER